KNNTRPKKEKESTHAKTHHTPLRTACRRHLDHHRNRDYHRLIAHPYTSRHCIHPSLLLINQRGSRNKLQNLFLDLWSLTPYIFISSILSPQQLVDAPSSQVARHSCFHTT